MARRRGRLGTHLVTDDNYGTTTYVDHVTRDYWGNYSEFVYKRNLQEIATPLNDPFPVDIFRGPQYEPTTACQFETSPAFIGNTNVPFPQTSAYAQFVNLDPGIGTATVGCTLKVH